jgi:cell division protein YceG involved in septum cleavage
LQSLIFLLVLVGGLGYWQWQTWLQPVGGPEPIQVTIQPGSSSRLIGQKLRQAGVIRSALAWELWSRTFGRDWVFQAGTYALDPNQDMLAVAQQLRQGRILQRRLTIPEGWRARTPETVRHMAPLCRLAHPGWMRDWVSRTLPEALPAAHAPQLRPCSIEPVH